MRAGRFKAQIVLCAIGIFDLPYIFGNFAPQFPEKHRRNPRRWADSFRWSSRVPRPEPSHLIALLHDDASLGLRARIYRTCLDAILDGTLSPGARIPSARRLALDWRVARNTVDEALAELQAEGWIERRVGDGTRVAQVLREPRERVRSVAPRCPLSTSRSC